MVAWVNASLFHVKMWVLFHRHSFLSVVSSDVLKNLTLRKWIAVLVEPSQPEPRGLCVEIVCYAKVVFANPENETSCLNVVVVCDFLFLKFLLSEHVRTIIVVVILDIV